MMNNMHSFRNNEHIKRNQIEPSDNIDDKVVLSNNETDKNLYDKDTNSSMIMTPKNCNSHPDAIFK